MLSASFIFTETELDADFFRLDGLIAEAAEATPGFLGKENWVTADGTKKNSVYYWQDQAALQAFSRHPLHLEAKQQYQKWYGGFHVVISEIVKSYGDGALAHITPKIAPCNAPKPLDPSAPSAYTAAFPVGYADSGRWFMEPSGA